MYIVLDEVRQKDDGEEAGDEKKSNCEARFEKGAEKIEHFW